MSSKDPLQELEDIQQQQAELQKQATALVGQIKNQPSSKAQANDGPNPSSQHHPFPGSSPEHGSPAQTNSFKRVLSINPNSGLVQTTYYASPASPDGRPAPDDFLRSPAHSPTSPAYDLDSRPNENALWVTPLDPPAPSSPGDRASRGCSPVSRAFSPPSPSGLVSDGHDLASSA
ncbi:hypothetical protein BDV25DRAFT_145599 [Aspergillus avenaceus]|uniref:Uncharacterized protein n=1 Tax=Aspergillus avenaceus TaxID=36643 RepID=A0A5N6TDK0_ASPAV|nr:hypothetical protein BDV25DRAFT_145599 [Aspergillus avenaceus]